MSFSPAWPARPNHRAKELTGTARARTVRRRPWRANSTTPSASVVASPTVEHINAARARAAAVMSRPSGLVNLGAPSR